MTPISNLGEPIEALAFPSSLAPSAEGQNGNGHPTNDIPSIEQTTFEPSHQSSRRQELITSLKFFESIEEVQDIAVELAFAEESKQEIIDELKTLHKQRIADLDGKCRAQENFQKTRTLITNARIVRETHALIQARTKLATLETEDQQLKARGEVVSNEISLSLQQLKQERLQNEKQFFDREIIRLQNKQRSNEAVEDISEQFALAEKIHELKQREYELNRPEFQREADDAARERIGVEARLKQIRVRLERFQQLGVTKTTAGFLVHAGYASFAAVGALIAGFFHKRQDAGGDFLSRIIGGVRSLIGLSEGGWSIWSPLLNLILLVVSAVAVISVTTVVINWFIGKVDPKWPKRSTRQRRTEGKSVVDLMKDLGSWVGSLFQSEQEDQQSRKRSNKDEGSHLDQRAFVQLLAQMPFIISAALVLFFFAALGLGSNSSTGTALPLEISSTYIGVIFLTLSTSAAILYVTNVIEPRWHRIETRGLAPLEHEGTAAPDQGVTPVALVDGRSRFIEILKLNWEFVVLVVTLVLSLAMTAFLPGGDTYNRWALGSVAIFMSLASLGLAYGLVQRGLFRDCDVMERNRQELLEKINACNELPTIEGVFENFDANEIGEQFRESRLTQHKLDDLRVIYELNRVFGRNFADDTKLKKFLGQFVSSEISLEGMQRPTGPIDAFDGQFPVAAEKLEAYYSLQDRLGQLNTQITVNREELDKVRSQAEKLNADLDRLYEELLDQERGVIEIRREFSERRQQLDLIHTKEIMWFKAAYHIGDTARTLLRPRLKEHRAANESSEHR